jgi:hypothetical protein
VASMSDVTLESANKLSLVSCLLENTFVFKQCENPAVLKAYREKVGLLNYLVNKHVPKGFENILFTNFVHREDFNPFLEFLYPPGYKKNSTQNKHDGLADNGGLAPNQVS